MKQLSPSKWLTMAGLLLALPTAYIICISLLKFEFGVDGPFDTAQPVLERWGIKEPPGWNISLLVLFGPIAGFLLTLFQVLAIKWKFTKDHFEFQFTITKRWFPLLVAAFSVSVLAGLTLYMFGENCTC